MQNKCWLAAAYALTLAAILTSISCARATADSSIVQNNAGIISHEGIQRTFQIHVPITLKDKTPLPLVIALHGGGGNGEKMERLSGLSGQADKDGFMVVYPDALDKHWNDGRGLRKYRSQRENIDDVGFISKLIDTLAQDYPIDPKRVYVTGASNGAMMAYRLACELTDKIAAIAPVIGAMGENTAKTCSPTEPLAVLIIGGTADPLVPWEGGDIRFFRQRFGKVISFEDTLTFWVSHNGCSAPADISWLPDMDPNDGTRVKKTVYGQCLQGAEMALYEIQGGGHTWPSGPQYLPESFIGKTSRDFRASEVIWKFFQKFCK
jgi:polyhydroxybutyrate depolymerase